MNLIQQFFKDEHTREAVKGFLLEYLHTKAGDMAFQGDDTKYIKQAKDVVEEAWNKLEQLYGEKKEGKKENPAR